MRSLKDLPGSFGTTKEGSSLIQLGKKSVEVTTKRDVLQVLQSSPTVCSCFLCSQYFRRGIWTRAFWLSHVNCPDFELLRDCRCLLPELSLLVTLAASYHFVLPSGLTNLVVDRQI